MVVVHTVSAAPGGEAFLLTTASQGILVDSGYDFRSDMLTCMVKDILGARPLTAVFVTHSHYDHVSGCPRILRIYPSAKIVASARTAELLEKPEVRQTIRHLNEAVAAQYGEEYIDHTERLQVDITLADRQTIDFGPLRFTALETPGHTRCCMSFYLHGAELLACSDTVGAWIGGRLLPAFVSSYHDSLRSIDKCADTHPTRILAPHYGEITGKEALAFFPHAREVAEGAALFIWNSHRHGLDEDAIVQAYIREYYPTNSYLPREAILLNVGAMVSRLLAIEESDG